MDSNTGQTYSFDDMTSDGPSMFLPLVGKLVKVMRPGMNDVRTNQGVKTFPLVWAVGVLEYVEQFEWNQMLFGFRGGMNIAVFSGSYIQLEVVEQ